MRKVLDVTITDEGRDKGNVYRITEMPSSKAEKWAARAILALCKIGFDVPEGAGMEFIAVAGLKALVGISFADAESLLDEMMECIQKIEDPSRPNVARALVENDIEEVETRLHLRAEVFSLHVGFSLRDALSKLKSGTTSLAS